MVSSVRLGAMVRPRLTVGRLVSTRCTLVVDTACTVGNAGGPAVVAVAVVAGAALVLGLATGAGGRVVAGAGVVVAGAEMLEAVGGKNILPFQLDDPPGLTIHEMGTARMGRDPKTSVLNSFNQAHEVKNLFVTDGAAMASSSCVNPSLTYMALTARACDYAVSQMKKGEL